MNYQYRKLAAHGVCKVCRKEILKDTEEAFRIPGERRGYVTICQECFSEMYSEMIMRKEKEE